MAVRSYYGDGALYVTYGNHCGPNGVSDGAVWKLDTKSGEWTNISPVKPGGDDRFEDDLGAVRLIDATAEATGRLVYEAIGALGIALTADIAVPKDRTPSQMGGDIPVTYVPARNTIFLAFALAWAEVLTASDVVIGVNVLDASGYPDCRPEFVEAFERLAALATRAGVEGRHALRIRTPLIRLTKAEIIRAGVAAGVDYALTLSCYDPSPDGAACGRCDACALRRKGFVEAGVPDPTRYRAG